MLKLWNIVWTKSNVFISNAIALGTILKFSRTYSNISLLYYTLPWMTLYYHHNSRYLTFKPMITLTSLLLILITLCIIQLWCMWHYHNPFQFYPMDQSCDILSMHRCLSFDTSMRQMGRKFDDKGVSQIDLTTRGHPYSICIECLMH